MVESTALEMRHTGNRIVGSNPTLSAIIRAIDFMRFSKAPDWVHTYLYAIPIALSWEKPELK